MYQLTIIYANKSKLEADMKRFAELDGVTDMRVEVISVDLQKKMARTSRAE